MFSRIGSTVALIGLLTPFLTADTLNAAEVARYLFEEGSGPILDSAPLSGLDNGTLVGDASYVPSPGHPAGGLFSIDINGAGAINLGQVDFLSGAPGATVMTWINLDGYSKSGSTHFVHVSNPAAPTSTRALLRLVAEGGETFFQAGGRSAGNETNAQLVRSSSSLEDLGYGTGSTATGWFHLAMTLDYASDAVSIYLNGNPLTTAGTITFTDDAGATGNSLAAIGAGTAAGGGFNNYMNGRVEDVRIFNSALTATEIQTLAVPEPASAALLGMGCLFLAGRRRRRR